MGFSLPVLHRQPYIEAVLPRLCLCDIGAALLRAEPPSYLPFIDAGLATLIAAEPDQNALPALREKFPPPHRIIDRPIGRGGAATLHLTNTGYTSSLYEPNLDLMERFQDLAEHCQVVDRIPVETVRLDDVLDGQQPDFLKMDVQGAELDVLTGAEKALETVQVVQTEVEFIELYKGQPLFADIDTAMRKAGFQFHTFLGSATRTYKPISLPKGGAQGVKQLLWGEAVYIRSVETWTEMETSSLIKMAVLLQDLYQSFDAVAAILRTIDARDGSDFANRFFNALAGR
ncbi:MAG: FkbM family methyltransferase [Alphaproteobacteria bacterium]